MDSQKAQKIADYIFEDVFGIKSPHSLDELKKKFAIDVPSAQKVKCSLSSVDTWTISPNEKIATQKAIEERFKKDEWIVKKEGFKSITDILKAWEKINYLTGEKYINSIDVAQSDGIYNSASVYHSISVFDSKILYFLIKYLTVTICLRPEIIHHAPLVFG